MTFEVNESLKTALQRATDFLFQAGVEDASRDARILLSCATDVRMSELISGTPAHLDPKSAALFSEFILRRSRREPVSRILGARSFWKYDFLIGSGVLDPRPDSETIVEAAVSLMNGRLSHELRIVDFGVGSGALLCSLLGEFPNASGIGIDLSEDACAIAQTNLAKLGFAGRGQIRCGEWKCVPPGHYDLIVSNPPYIEQGAIAGLEEEVRKWDPMLALDGGPDGLTAYRELAPVIAGSLALDGLALLEVGAGQMSQAAEIMHEAGLTAAKSICDLSGIERVLVVMR